MCKQASPHSSGAADVTTQLQNSRVMGDKYFKHTHLAATFRVEWLSKAVPGHPTHLHRQDQDCRTGLPWPPLEALTPTTSPDSSPSCQLQTTLSGHHGLSQLHCSAMTPTADSELKLSNDKSVLSNGLEGRATTPFPSLPLGQKKSKWKPLGGLALAPASAFCSVDNRGFIQPLTAYQASQF